MPDLVSLDLDIVWKIKCCKLMSDSVDRLLSFGASVTKAFGHEVCTMGKHN